MFHSLIDLLRGKYVLCSCEGQAEQAIIDLLIDNNFLCFQRKDLLEEECTRIRDAEKLATKYLSMEMEREIAILRILDRPREKFVLPKAYQMRKDISVFNVITKPEIEILHLIDAGLYRNFNKQKKNGLCASEYCKANISNSKKKCNVKSRNFVMQRYEANPNRLVDAIIQYKALTHPKEYCLSDLLCV